MVIDLVKFCVWNNSASLTLSFLCVCFTFFSESSKFWFGVGFFPPFTKFSPALEPQAVRLEQALHHPGCSGPTWVRGGGTLGCCPPSQALASEFCRWFQPEQCQSCRIGFSGSSEPVTKGVCCADLMPPSCCDGLIRYFMLGGFYRRNV